jgi:methanogenic corrinoid protein MtbC1
MRILACLSLSRWDTRACSGKEEKLRNDDIGALSLDTSQYLEAQAQLRSLKSQLPIGAVELLAREVIRRVASREKLGPQASPSEDKIHMLCDALLSEDDKAGARFIEEVRTEGVSIDIVYLEYLGAAARKLGTMWDENHISFVEVTLGVSRIYAILRALRHLLVFDYSTTTQSAVFAAVPGEIHNLGIRMASDLFRKNGWDINLKVALSHEELVDEISRSKASIIGLSASGDHSIEALSRLVIALRLSNPHANIFVSGSIVQEANETVGLMGVDGMASDIEEARELMSSFLETRVR